MSISFRHNETRLQLLQAHIFVVILNSFPSLPFHFRFSSIFPSLPSSLPNQDISFLFSLPWKSQDRGHNFQTREGQSSGTPSGRGSQAMSSAAPRRGVTRLQSSPGSRCRFLSAGKPTKTNLKPSMRMPSVLNNSVWLKCKTCFDNFPYDIQHAQYIQIIIKPFKVLVFHHQNKFQFIIEFHFPSNIILA